MTRFVFLSIFFLGWAFYEVSGGNEFTPEEPARIAKYEALEAERAEAARLAEAARKAAIAERARLNEQNRQGIQLASLGTAGTASVDIGPSSPERTPTARRDDLFSQPVPTPEQDKTQIGPDPSETSVDEETHQAPVDLRKVRASRVNMRGGPGTNYSVLAKLSRDDEVIVLEDPGTGWVKLEVVESEQIGWMSARLLVKVSAD